MTIDVSTITPADFKAQFPRGFPYLSAYAYDNAATYNTGALVYYSTNGSFYKALANGITGVLPPSDAAKWEVQPEQSVDNFVQDSDITAAFAEARTVYNLALYPTDESARLAYLYLTAHFLAYDLRAAAAGFMAAGSGSFPVQSRSVGSVSESYSIPKAYLDDPNLVGYTSTSYGLKFLQMTLPKLVGNMVAVCAPALP